MVLDFIHITPEGNKEILLESQKRRFQSDEIISECEELYKKWKVVRGNQDTNNMNRNIVVKKIGERKKANKADNCDELLKEKAEIEVNIELLDKELEQLWSNLMKRYSKIGNLVHETVPNSNDEKDNKVERTWGTPNKMKIDGKPGSAHHHQILQWIGGYDPERGTKLSGHRGYFLKGYGVLLNQALIQYGLQFLTKSKYTPIQTPFFMKQEIMAETCQLSDFNESLYK